MKDSLSLLTTVSIYNKSYRNTKLWPQNFSNTDRLKIPQRTRHGLMEEPNRHTNLSCLPGPYPPWQRRCGGGQHVAYTLSRVRLPLTGSIFSNTGGTHGKFVLLLGEHGRPWELRKTTHIKHCCCVWCTGGMQSRFQPHKGAPLPERSPGGVDCN